MRPRRILLYLVLALAVPLPALALTGPSDPPLPRADSLGVAASLDECGLFENAIVCKIDATFNPVQGGKVYRASVSRPDGSSVNYGQISPGGASSFWVPYAGDGTYTVQVSAYGDVKTYGQRDRVAHDRARAGGSKHRSHHQGRHTLEDGVITPTDLQGPIATDGAGSSATDGGTGADGSGSSGDDQDTPPQDGTTCDELHPSPPPGDTTTRTTTTTEGTTTTTTTTEPETQPEVPQSVDCPDGSSTSGTVAP